LNQHCFISQASWVYIGWKMRKCAKRCAKKVAPIGGYWQRWVWPIGRVCTGIGKGIEKERGLVLFLV
jgi:hypothetical protein